MSEIPDEIWEKAQALRNAVLWESNSAVEHIARALMAERERCAKIAGHYGDFKVDTDYGAGYKQSALNIASAIRGTA